jgi:hypothetical protein
MGTLLTVADKANHLELFIANISMCHITIAQVM